jgi:AbrB family looped-hinge helix DNA binding protein
MKIGERGQITIPKHLRERFGLMPSTEVEFRVVRGKLTLRKKTSRTQRTKLRNWVGFLNGKPEDVDRFVEDIRGR